MEVAGLVIGIIPILFQALDTYKDGFRRIKAGFRKREHIKKLARALRMQGQILDALIRDILLYSGLTPPSDEAQLQIFLQHPATKDEIVDYLGDVNARVLTEALEDCLSTVQNVALKVAELVPSIKANSQIHELLNENCNAKQGQIDLMARITLIVSLTDLEHDIEALDRSSSTLERFANRIMKNSSLIQSQPSRKAGRLAKSLYAIRRDADRLYTTIAGYWPKPCHVNHDIKIFLDERADSFQSKAGEADSYNSFRVVFTSGEHDQHVLWHDTTIHIANAEVQSSATAQHSKVQIVVPIPLQTLTLHDPVTDLCLAVQDAVLKSSQIDFQLFNNHTLFVNPTTINIQTRNPKTKTINLSSILKNSTTQSRVPSFKSRMVLAVKLASSFLQFLRTPWIRAPLSLTEVHLLGSTTTQPSTAIDLTQAHLSRTFTTSSNNNPNKTTQPPTQFKDDLINLGILLLELWHWTSLETRFTASSASSSTITDPFHRRVYALEWLEDVQDPLPELYNKAVSHCVVGVSITDQIRSCQWDDIQLWKVLCENIIEPLVKVSKI